MDYEKRISALQEKVRLENSKPNPNEDNITRWGAEVVRLGKLQFRSQIVKRYDW